MNGFNTILLPSIPIAEYDFSNHPSKPNILKLFKKFLTTPHSLVKNGKSSYNNFSKFESINFLYNDKELYKDFQNCADEYCDTLGIKPGVITQSWFNKMNTGGHTVPHTHWGTLVVGAYYPKLEPNTCDLLITNPTRNLYGAQIPIKDTEYNSPKFKIQVKQDHLYIFPGWVEHSTEINKGGERIVISFNVYPKRS